MASLSVHPSAFVAVTVYVPAVPMTKAAEVAPVFHA